jgi:hypothetical protein
MLYFVVGLFFSISLLGILTVEALHHIRNMAQGATMICFEVRIQGQPCGGRKPSTDEMPLYHRHLLRDADH